MTRVVRLAATVRSAASMSRSVRRVERAGGLVEDQDARVLEDGAGDGDALLLAAGEFQAALADAGVVALGQAQDEVVHLGEAGGVLDLGLAWRRGGRRRCCSRWCR